MNSNRRRFPATRTCLPFFLLLIFVLFGLQQWQLNQEMHMLQVNHGDIVPSKEEMMSIKMEMLLKMKNLLIGSADNDTTLTPPDNLHNIEFKYKLQSTLSNDHTASQHHNWWLIQYDQFNSFHNPVCKHVLIEKSISTSKYIIALDYWEGTTMATNNMLKLVCIAEEIKARLLQPFTRNSFLFGLPQVKLFQRPPIFTQPLELLYNMTSFNAQLCKYGHPPLAGLSEFLSNADRHVLFIHFIYMIVYHPPGQPTLVGSGTSKEELRRLFKQGPIINCTGVKFMMKIERDTLKSLNDETHTFQLPPFQATHRHCCINATLQTSMEHILQMCGYSIHENYTLVIPYWRGTAPHDPKHLRTHVFGLHEIDNPFTLHKQLYPVSSHVHHAVDAFLRTHTNGSDFIGFHIRSERLGHVENVRPGTFASCLKVAMKKLKEIRGNYTGLSLISFSDTGRFGSQTCHKCLGQSLAKAEFLKYNLTFTPFQPEMYRNFDDAGFVAQVEGEVLSRAVYLVMVGGGSFQRKILQQARLNGHVMKFAHICPRDGEVQSSYSA